MLVFLGVFLPQTRLFFIAGPSVWRWFLINSPSFSPVIVWSEGLTDLPEKYSKKTLARIEKHEGDRQYNVFNWYPPICIPIGIYNKLVYKLDYKLVYTITNSCGFWNPIVFTNDLLEQIFLLHSPSRPLPWGDWANSNIRTCTYELFTNNQAWGCFRHESHNQLHIWYIYIYNIYI